MSSSCSLDSPYRSSGACGDATSAAAPSTRCSLRFGLLRLWREFAKQASTLAHSAERFAFCSTFLRSKRTSHDHMSRSHVVGGIIRCANQPHRQAPMSSVSDWDMSKMDMSILRARVYIPVFGRQNQDLGTLKKCNSVTHMLFASVMLQLMWKSQ